MTSTPSSSPHSSLAPHITHPPANQGAGGRNKEHVITPEVAHVGVIAAVEPGSLSADLGLRPGDELLAVNGYPVEDVIDVQFYSAEEHVELTVRREDQQFAVGHDRDYDQPLGLDFTHPTFDVDIRRCNNLCTFCFVLQMAPKLRRTLYIKDDDYRYSFLYGHFVTLTNLSEHDCQRIEGQHLSPLYVSVHATELDLRRKLLRNDTAPDILDQLRWLSKCGIQVHTQIVVTPGLNDAEHLERSVRDLSGLWPAVQSVSIVPVGITRHHKYGERPNTVAEGHLVLDNVTSGKRNFEKNGRALHIPRTNGGMLPGAHPAARAYDGLPPGRKRLSAWCGHF
jgi:putative radical SAM enzyme (TIGR03279 family)